VLAAIQRARTLFPFPILLMDTDNGGEFLNGTLIAYGEQEQLTFTRGRPYVKNDQCFVEQKNGAIVRHELNAVAQSLDPVRLFHQLEQLQKALFRCAVEGNPFVSNASSLPIRVFAVEQCRTGLGAVEGSVPDAPAGLPALYKEQEKRKRVLRWRRTHKDPFEGEWEQITSWLIANPERSSGDIFRELQRLSPGRYQPLQIRTLQRGMRKIRAHLLETVEDEWQTEVIRGASPPPVSSAANQNFLTAAI